MSEETKLWPPAKFMPDFRSGERLGPFVVIPDQDGRRHAIRASAILTISDDSDCGSMTTLRFAGQRTAVLHESFESVVAWFLT